MSTEVIARRSCAVVRVSATCSDDTNQSVKLVHDALVEAGHHVIHQRCILDDLTNIRYLFREWVDDARVDVIIAIGGTGLDSADVTPEALSPFVTKPMPGFGELFRALSFQELGIRAIETRAMAAVCHATLVYLIPAAPMAVERAMQRLIIPQLGERLPTERLRPKSMPEIRMPQTPAE